LLYVTISSTETTEHMHNMCPACPLSDLATNA
jgi:hypothetical protein